MVDNCPFLLFSLRQNDKLFLQISKINDFWHKTKHFTFKHSFWLSTDWVRSRIIPSSPPGWWFAYRYMQTTLLHTDHHSISHRKLWQIFHVVFNNMLHWHKQTFEKASCVVSFMTYLLNNWGWKVQSPFNIPTFWVRLCSCL